MWVSTKAQYGMRALIEVAVGGDRPTSLKTVADRQELSHQYLEQIFAVLRRAGIVESVRGARGGYRLARQPDRITALDVVERLEGSVAPVTCIDDEEGCERVGACSTEPLWREVDQAVRRVLGGTTLADMMAERQLLNIEPLPETFALSR
jgi:Rrf2 family protein